MKLRGGGGSTDRWEHGIFAPHPSRHSHLLLLVVVVDSFQIEI